MASYAQAKDFLDTIIKPTVTHLGLSSTSAEELLLGTALVESNLVYRSQLGNGPARGLFQMEMATHDDIWDNYLKYHGGLAALVKGLKTTVNASAENELKNNDKYACAMARVHYKRVLEALPDSGNSELMGAYWKKYYNTVFGGGTVQKYIDAWVAAMGTPS